jgi:hypothetical protein
MIKIVSYPDGSVVTVVDVLHITHAAIATVSDKLPGPSA